MIIYAFDYGQLLEDKMDFEDDEQPEEESKPLHVNPVTNILDDACLDLSDSFPVLFNAEVKDVKKDEPHVDKKRKQENNIKKEKPHVKKKKKKMGKFERLQVQVEELTNNVQTFVSLFRRLTTSLKMEVDRKEIYK